MKIIFLAVVNYLSDTFSDISMQDVFDFASFIIFILIIYALLTTP